MTTVEMSVKGVKRRVHLEKEISPNLWRARINVGKRTVSGMVRVNTKGVRRFTPIGVNAELV